jgi:allantoinase
MADFDLIVRGAMAALPAGVEPADVALSDGLIAAIGAAGALAGSAVVELDARGLHMLPGGVDVHVHFSEPGRSEWEGFQSGSSALAAGGISSFIDMPLSASPPTVDAAAFDLKLACALASSRLDFALWGGLVPGKLDAMEKLAERGVAGFKAFMCETGQDDFRPVDDATLWDGMRRAAALDSIVAVHAENESITSSLAERARATGDVGARDYLASRPAIAEIEAIGRATALAADTGCRLHVVHVSTAEGVELVRDARQRGVDVSWETTAHFLALTDADVERLGVVAKCAPVMRGEDNRMALWDAVAGDPLAIVSSDHAPSPWILKEDRDFFAAWGGVSTCQSTLPILLEALGRDRLLTLDAVVGAVSANAASRFGLSTKGAIEIGRDGDLALVDLDATWTLTAEELRYRHRHSPFVGLPMRGRVRHLFSRGRAIVTDGEIVGEARGVLLRPDRHTATVSLAPPDAARLADLEHVL